MKTKLLCALALTTAACASYPAPTEHLASSVAAARGAQEAGATQVPEAALQLKMSEEQITTAKKMMAKGNNEHADYMTLRAYNDAALSLALTREEAARRRAQQSAELARLAAERERESVAQQNLSQ
ncbi:MAG: hypothetical protein QM778_10365 [Myxococcales bacterium]